MKGKNYHDGIVTKSSDGKFSASYLNHRSGKPYQALAGQGYGFKTEREAESAIDRANGAQDEYLSRVDAVTYDEIRELAQGRLNVKWYRPTFWGARDEVLRVIYVGSSYILSISNHGSSVYISSSDTDCQFIFTATGDIFGQSKAWAQRFEAPVSDTPAHCHYCGQEASGSGFFDESVCSECGG